MHTTHTSGSGVVTILDFYTCHLSQVARLSSDAYSSYVWVSSSHYSKLFCLKRMTYYQQHCKWALTTVATVSTRDEFFRLLLPILLFCTKAETADWNWFSNRLKRKTDKKSTECTKGANRNTQNHRHVSCNR